MGAARGGRRPQQAGLRGSMPRSKAGHLTGAAWAHGFARADRCSSAMNVAASSRAHRWLSSMTCRARAHRRSPTMIAVAGARGNVAEVILTGVREACACSMAMARGEERPRREAGTSRHVHAGLEHFMSDKHPAGSEGHGRAVGGRRAEHLVTSLRTHLQSSTPQISSLNTSRPNVVHVRLPRARR